MGKDVCCTDHPDTNAIAKCEECGKLLCLNCLIKRPMVNVSRIQELCSECDAKFQAFQDRFLGNKLNKAKKKIKKKFLK